VIGRDFFQRDPLTCARELIGCELVWNGCSGILVETEAYTALNDEACHTFHRPSARRFIEEHPPGAAYVYLNYGMYWLLNVLVKGGREDGFVLFRALEPRAGIGVMQARRALTKLTQLCSGPGKLTRALAITGADHGRDLCAEQEVGFRRLPRAKVAADVRVGDRKSVGFAVALFAGGQRFCERGGWTGEKGVMTRQESQAGFSQTGLASSVTRFCAAAGLLRVAGRMRRSGVRLFVMSASAQAQSHRDQCENC